jgi:hypothetical protein
MPDFVDDRIRDLVTKIAEVGLEVNDMASAIDAAKGFRPVDPNLGLKELELQDKIGEMNGLKDRLKMWRAIKELGGDPILMGAPGELTRSSRRSPRHEHPEPRDGKANGHECPERGGTDAPGEAA